MGGTGPGTVEGRAGGQRAAPGLPGEAHAAPPPSGDSPAHGGVPRRPPGMGGQAARSQPGQKGGE